MLHGIMWLEIHTARQALLTLLLCKVRLHLPFDLLYDWIVLVAALVASILILLLLLAFL